MPRSSGSKSKPSNQIAELAWHYIPQDKTPHSHNNENHISDSANMHSVLRVALYMMG